MYFNEEGKTNTEATVKLAIKTAKERNIRNIVVATNSGYTASFIEAPDNLNIVCVTHVFGFKEPGKNEMTDDERNKLLNEGYKVLTTTHVLSGVERGISRKSGGMYPAEIIANSLRMFGQGVKVCVEISTMALDAGLIPYGEEIIAIAGTGRGADTSIIITPAHASDIFETRINEIICKPY